MKISFNNLRRKGWMIPLFFVWTNSVFAQPPFELSRNIYRTPYDDGETFDVRQDYLTHSPLGRFDLRAQGTDDCNTHRIVAAAAGIVRIIRESNESSCPDCVASNNYIWIEHANGEWAKYTHLKKNSVPVSVGDVVCAGSFLGYECYIGATSPAEFRHLHFEVRRPYDPDNIPIDTVNGGGYLDGAFAAHLLPVIQSTSKHYFEKGDTWTGTNTATCSNSLLYLASQQYVSGEVKIFLATGTIANNNNSVTFESGSTGLYSVGTSVTLTPGFIAKSGSFFAARIGSCDTTPFPGGCN